MAMAMLVTAMRMTWLVMVLPRVMVMMILLMMMMMIMMLGKPPNRTNQS